MLTRLRVRNFKTLEDIDIPLGQNVVLIGPNNSGKTSALQALALWRTALVAWERALEREQVSGILVRFVTINRRDIAQTPLSDAAAMWRNRKAVNFDSKNQEDILVEVSVEGETRGVIWKSGFAFQLANAESIYCWPSEGVFAGEPTPPSAEKFDAAIAFLAPMSGLATEEAELQSGRISVLIGEGQTAQVLRNLCLSVAEANPTAWRKIVYELQRTFGIELQAPMRDRGRGIVELFYTERGSRFDISAGGRGMQQTLLLLAHLYANPGSTLLLDEPDAHLEILRQRQIYSLITESARLTESQVIAASHSEVLLNEAADRDVVIAFVGKPHRVDDRGSQVLKSLKEIGFDQYYQAEQRGFVIYLEGSTDLAILRAFARKLGHPVQATLDAPFVHYVLNQPQQALHHFYGLREAKPDLKGFAVFDRLERGVPHGFTLPHFEWKKREIENYLCTPTILQRYAEGMEPDDLIGRALRDERREKMAEAIAKIEAALKTLGRDPWSPDFKVSDDFLKPLFETYFASLGGDNRLNKSNYHELAEFIEPQEIDADVVQCLDRLVAAESA